MVIEFEILGLNLCLVNCVQWPGIRLCQVAASNRFALIRMPTAVLGTPPSPYPLESLTANSKYQIPIQIPTSACLDALR